MDRYLSDNQALWNAWTPFHVESDFYDVEGFKAGRETLHSIEHSALGDVQGKSLLHLQCHFGMDTLSWARRGAIVTGVDFSEEAIAAARRLSDEVDVPATFVLSDIYKLPENLEDQFDIVFTSYGVLDWLPDLAEWAQVISEFLKPNGVFFIVEAHPFIMLFDEKRDDSALRVRYSYFPGEAPLEIEEEGTYAVPEAPIRQKAHYWIHSLAEILGALKKAGLIIDNFEEYPFMSWAFFPWLEQRAPGEWRMPEGRPDLPLMFSIRATKHS